MGTFTITQTQEGGELYLQPNEDGCNIDLTPIGDVFNYECVDDAIATPDDDATYVYSTAIGLLYDLYTLPNHTTETGTINFVQIFARAKSDTDAQAGTGIFKIILTENACANVYKSNDINLTTVYTSYVNTWTLNPRTNAAWSWSDIDNLQVGIECSSPTILTDKILTIRPNGIGNDTELSPTPSTLDNYECVDEATPDWFSTNVWTLTNDGEDTYEFDDHTTETGTIKKVTIFTWVRGSGDINAKTVVRMGGTNYYGDIESPPAGDWTLISTDYTTNPNTGTAWTWANIDDFQGGIYLYGHVSNKQYCTQAYVVIHYTENINPEIRTTQVYAKVNYNNTVTCSLNMPKQVSVDHQQNIKMLNFWSGNRAVYGLTRSKRTMVLTGTQYGKNSCSEIECVRAMGEAGDEISTSGLGSSEFDKTFRIISFGWIKVTDAPLTMNWMLELEYTT